MIDFATLKGLTIPEGLVTQITDASGRVLWAVSGGGKVVLGVEKITSDTSSAETTYAAEEFILLDIYPKTNGTVKVTYGGLTKTITDTSGAEEPNAQQVFFGTFNGVSDSVTTPTSGELTIRGEYYSFGCSSYSFNKITNKRCGCIISVIDWGSNEITICNNMFEGCAGLTAIDIPDGVTTISDSMFRNCKGLTNVDNVLDGVTHIGNNAFEGCAGLTSLTIPATVTSIGESPWLHSGDLAPIIVLPTTPPVYTGTKYSIFAGITNVAGNGDEKTIFVPNGCLSAYQAAEGWSIYANHMAEVSQL